MSKGGKKEQTQLAAFQRKKKLLILFIHFGASWTPDEISANRVAVGNFRVPMFGAVGNIGVSGAVSDIVGAPIPNASIEGTHTAYLPPALTQMLLVVLLLGNI